MGTRIRERSEGSVGRATKDLPHRTSGKNTEGIDMSEVFDHQEGIDRVSSRRL